MRTLGIVIIGLLLIACGSDQSTPTAVDTIDVERTYNWKLVTTWPKNYPGLGTAPETFADLVVRMSAGRLQVEVFGAGQLVPAMEVFDAVSQGTAQMGHGAAYYWAGKAKGAAFFAAVPFGLNAQEMNAWLHHGGGLELWRELYAPFNLIPFAGGNTGVQMAGWFNRQINSIDDLADLKMRIPGLGGDVISLAGGTSWNIAGGDIYTAMQTGVIDATEWVGPYNDLAFGLHQVAKYYYYPGWHEPGVMAELTVNADAYAGLPDDLQAIIEVAARAVNQDMLDEYTAKNNRALVDLVDNHGVDLRRLPKPVLTQLRRMSAQVVDELAAENELTRRIADSVKAFKAQAMAYHVISEQAYNDARRADDE